MKNFLNRNCLLFLFAGSILSLSACSDDDETPAGDPGVNSYTTVLLGNQNNATDPHFYSSSANARYTLAEAKTNSGNVDFGYGNGSATGNEFFIGSPDDESIEQVYNDATNGVQTWSESNSTRFKLTSLTSAQFDTLSKQSALLAAVAAGTDPEVSSRVRGVEIEVNDVVAFTTDAGKDGLIKVISRSGTMTTGGSITLNVKVEK